MLVKTWTCAACRKGFDLFPGYALAEDARPTSYVLVCASCGDLNEVADPLHPGALHGQDFVRRSAGVGDGGAAITAPCHCGRALTTQGPVSRNKCYLASNPSAPLFPSFGKNRESASPETIPSRADSVEEVRALGWYLVCRCRVS